MAVALEPTLTSKSFHNWFKGALAVRFTKEGLEGLVITEISHCKNILLQGVWTSLGIPQGTVCGSCTTANLLTCPTQGYCKARRCNLHDSLVPDKRPGQPCPNRICDALRDSIRREHRFNGPSWKNTDARRWCSDAYEIAKCFLPPDGYAGVKRLAETDFNGIVSVIINNRRFQSLFTAQLNLPSNICTKAREIGRAVRHSPEFSMSDTELINCIDDLTNLLTDSGYLAADAKAQEAVQKLNLLRTNKLTIHANDITEILDDYFTKSISQKRCELVQEMEVIRLKNIDSLGEECKQICEDTKTDKESLQKAIETKTNTIFQKLETKEHGVIQSIESKSIGALRKLEEERKNALYDVNQQHQQIIKERTAILNFVAAHLAKVRAESINGIQMIMNAQLAALTEIKLQAKSEAKKLAISSRADLYSTKIGQTTDLDFKNELVKFYRENCQTLPISPLINDTDVPLLELYVQAQMEAVDLQQRLRSCKALSSKTTVKNYKQLLFRNECNPYKNIYITANAGEGKTSFSKYLCLIWCQAHKPLQGHSEKFEQDNIEAIKYFEFVFLISLRDVNRSLCDVDDFLLNFVKNHFPDLTRHSELVENILRNNNCLVVLDGLDEWKHPEECPIPRVDYDIPHAKCWQKCTIITTTRPWKFDVLRLPSTKVDQHIEIKELDSRSTALLERNILNLLQEPTASLEAHKSVDEFHDIVVSFKLQDICKIPYVNSQIMCLWFEGEELGRSKCEIFTNIIEITLERGVQKHGNQDPDTITQIEQSDIPEYMISKPQCCEHAMLLFRVGELAFHTLLTKSDESTLIFDKSVALKHLKSERALTFCLLTGLLSQSKGYGSVSRKHSNVTFQHKTLHEYFAALYLQKESDDSEAIKSFLGKCSSLTEILEMSNIIIFLCGLRPTLYCTLFEHLVKIVSVDEITAIHRTQMVWHRTRVKYYQAMFNYQSMQLDCMQEIKRHVNSNLNVHLEDIIINKRSKSGACISRLQDTLFNSQYTIKTLCLRDCEISEARSIMQSLNLLSLRSLEKLELWIDYDQQQNAEQLLSDNSKSLKVVDIRFHNFDYFPEETANVSPRNFQIHLTNMDFLQTFCLEFCFFAHDTLEHIANELSRRNTIRQIGMGYNQCSDHGPECNGVNLDLVKNKNLQCLYLVEVPISHLNVNIKSLEQCELGGLPSAVVSSWLQDLPQAENLKILSCAEFYGKDVVRIMEAIPKVLNLESLFICSSDIGYFRLSLPLEMDRLDQVWLYQVQIPIVTFRDLVNNLSNLSQPITVLMTNCRVTPAKEFETARKHMIRSDKFRVILDGINNTEFKFQTVKTTEILMTDCRVTFQTTKQLKDINGPVVNIDKKQCIIL